MTEEQAIYVLSLQVNEIIKNRDKKLVLGVVKNILDFIFHTMPKNERCDFIHEILQMSLEIDK